MATLTYEEYQKRVHENLKKKRSQSNASRKAAAPEGSKEYFDRMRKVEEGSKEYFDLMRKAPVVDSVRNRMTVAPLDDFDAPIDPKWLNKGLFEDGYDFGDVSKTILGISDKKELKTFEAPETTDSLEVLEQKVDYYKGRKWLTADQQKEMLKATKQYNDMALHQYSDTLSKTKMDGTDHTVLEEIEILANMKSGKEKDERKEKVLAKMEELGMDTAFYSHFAGDGEFDWGTFGSWLGNSAMAGLNMFNSSLLDTADVLLGAPLKALGWENNPISEGAEYYHDLYDTYKYNANLNAEKLGGNAWNFGAEAVEGTVGALPNALLMFMTGGQSATATTSSLMNNAAMQTGNVLTKAGLTTEAMLKNPQYWMSFARELGPNYKEAKELGASDTAASIGSVLKAMVNSGIEIGTDGGSGIQGLSDGLKNGGKPFWEWMESSIEEGGEEVLQKFVGEVINKFGYGSDEEILNPIEYAKEGTIGVISGMALGGGQTAVQSGVNAYAEHQANKLTENEQKVVDAVYKKRLAEEQKKGKADESKIYDDVIRDMDKGYITTDEIESALGGDTYSLYKNTVDGEDAILKEYEELGKKTNATLAEQSRYAELTQQVKDIREKSQRDALKTQLGQEVAELVKGDRLAESYNERARRGQAYQADLTKYDQKQQTVIQKAIDSGILNNTNRTHEFVDLVSKISADKGVLFDFTNNQKLKDSGFAVEGKQVNGYVTKDGITLNIDSKKALETTVGYEITHVLEGTEVYDAMKEAVFTYAKTKGEYDSRLKALTKLYENVKDANIEAELTADLVGNYIFSDADFVKSLVTGNRNVFQKIYDEIKYLCRSVTARSKEARQLEKVRKVFADAYRQDVKNTAEDGGVRYSLGDIKYPRTTVGYKDINARRAAEDSLAESLVERQKVTQVSIEDIPQEYAKTDWADSQKSRLCIKEILKQFLGEDVVFNLGDNSAIAYLTSRGVNHAASGANTESKAASFAKFYEIVSNAEYCYSCPKDTHSKTSGREDWDYFVSVAKMGEETIPLVFAVRSIDQDVRSQIYSIATKTDSTISHGDGTQGNPANAHPNYGDSSSPNKIIPQDGSMSSEADKKADFSLSSASAKPFDNGVALETPQLVKPATENSTEQMKTQSTVELSQDDIAPPPEKTATVPMDDLGPVRDDIPVRNTDVKFKKNNLASKAVTKVVEKLVDKGFTFEALAKATGNRELEAKYHNMRNSSSAAQNMIGKGIESKGIKSITEMRKKVRESGMQNQFAEYLSFLSAAESLSYRSDLKGVVNARINTLSARYLEGMHPEIKLYAEQYFAYANELRTMAAESGFSETDISKLFNELHSNALIGDGSFETLARVTEKVYKAVCKNEFGKELRKTLGFPAKESNNIAPEPSVTNKTDIAPAPSVDGKIKQYVWEMMDKARKLWDEGGDGVNSMASIQDALDRTGKEDDFHEYMYHKLNVDRITLFDRTGELGIAVYPSVSAHESQTEIDRLLKENPKFEEYAEQVYRFNEHLKNILVENGLLTKEQADKFSVEYPHYVPIRRAGFKYDPIPLIKKENSVAGESPIYNLQGSNKRILPLFSTMLARTFQTYAAVTERSLDITDSNINPQSGELFNDDSDSFNPTEMEDVLSQMFSEKDLLKEGTKGENPTLSVFENGERIEFDITDQMYDALKPRSSEKGRGRKLVEKALKTPSSTFRKLVTEWNPTFWFTNPIKDIQDVLVNSQHAAKTYASVPKAVAEIVHKGKYYQEYMEHVGNRETYFDMEKGKFVEEKPVAGAIQWPFKKIAAINNAVELTPRMAEYIASREEGRSIEVSILDAARVTTNFGAGGDVTKAVDSYFAPFLNASVQGAAQQVRNVAEASQQGFLGWLKLTSRVALAGLASQIPSLVNDLIWDDDEDYQDLSQYIKDDYYVFKVGDGKFFRIPKGRTVAAIQYAAKQMENAMTGDDVADLKTFANYVLDNIGINNPLTNNLIAPIVQVKKNEAWYGEQLVPDRLLKVPEDQQFDETTDEFSLKLYGLLREYNDDEDIGISPYQINYLLNQYGGGAADMLLPPITPKAEQGDDSILGNLLAPLKDKFTTDSVLKNQNVSDFYETEEALELLAADKNATMADKAKAAYMSEVGYDTAELYRKKREIQMSDLPAKEKYERARDIQKRINAMMENALDSYEDVYTKGIYAEIDGRRFNWSEEEGRMYEVTPLKADGTENWYYANEQKAVGRFGISYEEFWNNRDAYCEVNHYLDKRAEWNAGQERLYKVVDTVFGAKEFGQYATALNGFFADKDEQGNAISGTRKKKVVDYINGLNVPDAQKYILYKMEYPDNKDYNQEIFNYVEGQRHLSLGEKKAVLEALGMKVDYQGYVTW